MTKSIWRLVSATGAGASPTAPFGVVTTTETI